MDLQRLRVESFQCRNHPEREGVGICVACRRVFCVECSTKIDGVNHCRECLAKRQKTAQASAARRSGFLVRGFELLFSTAVVAGSVCLLFGIFMLLGESHKSGGHVANKDRMEAVSRALRAYRRDTGSFPTDQEGLEALARKPDAATGWQGPYVDPSLLDARGNVVDTFGSPVRYRAPRKGETACVVGSPGGDRVLQTDLDKVQPLKVSPNGEGAGEGDDLIIFVD